MSNEINEDYVSNTFLIVLYKMQLVDSLTFRSIENYIHTRYFQPTLSYRLVIWDNSPSPSYDEVSNFRAKLPALEIKYIHTPKNCSLSEIYNVVATKLAFNEYLTLLDQDTVLPIAYFEELRLAQSERWPLILPKAECQNLLVSPGRRYFARGIRLKDIKSGAVSSKNLLAINSGMSILCSVFQLFKYDERLRFYGTDTFFMRNYEKYFELAFVLKTPILHSLAKMESQSEEWWEAHSKEMLRTLYIVFDNSLAEKLFVQIYVAGLRVKSSLSKYLSTFS